MRVSRKGREDRKGREGIEGRESKKKSSQDDCISQSRGSPEHCVGAAGSPGGGSPLSLHR